jgi:hypothetical protein
VAGTVRTATTGPIANANRNCGVLSDGTTFWAAVEDNAVIYIYSSTDKVNWTLRTTFTPSPALSATGQWSIAQAANNDLAILWNPGVSTMSMHYVRFTFAAGPAWTAGSIESVLGATTFASGGVLNSVGGLDICFAAGVVPVIWFAVASSAAGLSYSRLRVRRTSDNTWVNCGTENGNTNRIACGYFDSLNGTFVNKARVMSVCSEYATAVPGSNLVLIATQVRTAAITNNSDALGDFTQIFELNVNTGALSNSDGDIIAMNGAVASNSYTVHSGSGAIARQYAIYSPAAGIFDVVMFYGNAAGSYLKVWRWFAQGGVSGTLNLSATKTLVNGVQQAVVTQDAITPTTVDRVGFMYVPITGSDTIANSSTATIGVLFTLTANGFRNTRMNAFRLWGSNTYAAGTQPYNAYLNRYWRPDAQLAHPWVDDNADKQYSMVSYAAPRARFARTALGLTYNSTSKKFLMQENVRPALVNSVPANGGTISTDTPVLTAAQSRGTTVAPNQQPWKPEIRIAKDAAYTTSLLDLTSLDTATSAVYADPAAGATVTSTLQIPVSSPLTQGVWYWSSRAWDLFQESQSGWSPDFTLTNSHPPSAVPITPSGGSTYDFGAAGVISFTFTYSDPSPISTMSAYEIIIENNVDGSSILDTGKVLKTSPQNVQNTVTISVPISAKDLQLRWKISVWDNENIQGSYYGASLFSVSDEPLVSITSPTQDQVVSSANPTIQWTFAATAGRKQAKYRVQIIDGTTNQTVVDTGYVNSSATTYTPSSPVLKNTSSYTLQVWVVDTAGLIGTSATAVNILSSQVASGGEVLASTAGFAAYNVSNQTSLSYSTGAKRSGVGGIITSSVSTGVGANSFGLRFGYTPYRPAVSGGQYLTVSASVFEGGTTTQHGTDWYIGVDWYDINGIYLSSSGLQTAVHVTLAGAWNRTYSVFLVPTGAVTAVFNLICSTAIANGSMVQLLADEFQVESASSGTMPPSTFGLILGVRNFTTSWTPPVAPAFSASPTSYEANGYLAITWTNALRDATWNSWRVYRRLTGSTSPPTLLAEYTSDLTNYEYDDYFAGANISYDYAVVQVADRFGSQIESAYNYTTIAPAGSHYWLIGIDVLTNASAVKIKLSQVTADSFSEEYEAAEMQIIGRGRRVDYGTRFGYKGSLTAQLRTDSTSTARAKRLQLEQVKAQKTALYLRNPFGDIWLVNLSDLQMDRLSGVGTEEFVNVTVPYSEVS